MTRPAPELIHLVCGPTGAGKSTYSAALARELGGVCFSIDEWMRQLHNMDRPDGAGFDWAYQRVLRNWSQMRAVSVQLASLAVPSVFDCGLTRVEERAIFADWAEVQGLSCRLHFLDVSSDLRWQRVQQRNREQAETFQFHVDRGMFDFIEGLWEAPTVDEKRRMPLTVICD